MTKDLDIDILRRGSCSVLSVSGDIDLETSPGVRAAILSLLKRRSQERIIVDLKGVSHMDCSGVAGLVEGLYEAKKRNARFILSGLNRLPRQVMDLNRLTEMFEITRTVEEALA